MPIPSLPSRLRALEKEAMKGLPQAGRELHAWLEKYPRRTSAGSPRRGPE
jgi:hypothetical protein